MMELDYFYNFLENPLISTIYIGGGTPSFLNKELLKDILEKINILKFQDNYEITLEANQGELFELKTTLLSSEEKSTSGYLTEKDLEVKVIPVEE